VLAALSELRLRAVTDLALGRERLLAGDVDAARSAFTSVSAIAHGSRVSFAA